MIYLNQHKVTSDLQFGFKEKISAQDAINKKISKF